MGSCPCSMSLCENSQTESPENPVSHLRILKNTLKCLKRNGKLKDTNCFWKPPSPCPKSPRQSPLRGGLGNGDWELLVNPGPLGYEPNTLTTAPLRCLLYWVFHNMCLNCTVQIVVLAILLILESNARLYLHNIAYLPTGPKVVLKHGANRT